MRKGRDNYSCTLLCNSDIAGTRLLGLPFHAAETKSRQTYLTARGLDTEPKIETGGTLVSVSVLSPRHGNSEPYLNFV
jgi:hypothetical protein